MLIAIGNLIRNYRKKSKSKFIEVYFIYSIREPVGTTSNLFLYTPENPKLIWGLWSRARLATPGLNVSFINDKGVQYATSVATGITGDFPYPNHPILNKFEVLYRADFNGRPLFPNTIVIRLNNVPITTLDNREIKFINKGSFIM